MTFPFSNWFEKPHVPEHGAIKQRTFTMSQQFILNLSIFFNSLQKLQSKHYPSPKFSEFLQFYLKQTHSNFKSTTPSNYVFLSNIFPFTFSWTSKHRHPCLFLSYDLHGCRKCSFCMEQETASPFPGHKKTPVALQLPAFLNNLKRKKLFISNFGS